MARPVWTGSVSFGLVNVGVGLYTATDSTSVSFHQLEKGTHKHVRNKRVAEDTDREVAYDDIVKGYEIGDGEHVFLTQDELDKAAPETSRTIVIEDFVELPEIDPIYYEQAYYLAPRSDDQERVYALLRDAMRNEGLAGIATFVMRNREYLAAIRATEEVLILHTMNFADEIRQPHDVFDQLPGDPGLKKQELESATKLIRELATTWEPEDYHDTYREKVLTLIEHKPKGEDTHVESEPEPQQNVVDLVAALEQSIGNAKDRGKGASKFADLTKEQLYDRAGRLDISGRSKMSKSELRQAVAEAS